MPIANVSMPSDAAQRLPLGIGSGSPDEEGADTSVTAFADMLRPKASQPIQISKTFHASSGNSMTGTTSTSDTSTVAITNHSLAFVFINSSNPLRPVCASHNAGPSEA